MKGHKDHKYGKLSLEGASNLNNCMRSPLSHLVPNSPPVVLCLPFDCHQHDPHYHELQPKYVRWESFWLIENVKDIS